MSRGPIPDLPRDRPTLPRARALKRGIYERSVVGCCLHIVLDDRNLDDAALLFCLARAEHEDCRELARIMLQMTRSQRRRLTV